MLTTQARVILFVAAVVCSFGAGLWTGKSWGDRNYDKLKTELAVANGKVDAVQKVVVPIVERDRIVYRDRVKTLEVPKIVEREVYKNVCLDEDGLRAFNTLMGR